MEVVHSEIHYFAAKTRYPHCQIMSSEKLQKVKYVKVDRGREDIFRCRRDTAENKAQDGAYSKIFS